MAMTLDMAMITVDCTDPQRLARFWTAALGTEVAQDYGDYLFLKPASGSCMGFQRVPESRAGKNRVHLDFRATDRPTEVSRLVGLGARELGEHSVPGLAWTVLADPEDNEFCVGMPTGS